MDELKLVLAANVKRYRVKARLTQREAARRAGMLPPNWNPVEKADGVISLSTLARIAAALGVEPWKLLKPGSGPTPTAGGSSRGNPG